MPSVRYYNQTAPFWDFVANLEDQGFNANHGQTFENENNDRSNPWAENWTGLPWGPFAHRGRHGQPRHHHGPPPPPGPGFAGGPTQPPTDGTAPSSPPQEGENEPEAGPSDSRDGGSHSHHGPRGHHGRCGGRGRGGFGGRGRGHWGGRFGPYPMAAFGPIVDMFQTQIFGDDNENKDKNADDFTPEVDVFDTPESFVIHVSLPGAKKEDVGVNWDAEKSELSIAGVVYRPGDEDFLKTLAMNERKVGAFERKVRLGSRANPAQVEVDGISARMENGVLTVEVPKLDSGYVEVKKVDIE